MHVSIWNAGSPPPMEECNTCCRRLFHCPLCPTFKPAKKAYIQRHVESHVKNSVHFKDKYICRCRLPCRTEGHFHCPLCEKTRIRRSDMEKHVLLCCGTSVALPPATSVPSARAPAVTSVHFVPAPTVTSVPSVPAPMATSVPSAPAPTVPSVHSVPAPMVTSAHSAPAPTVTLVPSAPHPVVPDHSYSLPPVVLESAASLNTVKCPHCTLILYKRNLGAHILRKHMDISRDITQTSHLMCVCVDETNGIFAVQRSGHGFSVPIHVQRKTWGKDHQVRCELEECQQYQLLARRSGLCYSLCEHIRSVDYCKETVAEVFLSREVLKEMVPLKFFGEAKVATCLKRQKAAQMAHVPFCVLLDFEGSPSHICLSIHEPQTQRFSRLGRIIVTYNSKNNTWHCACAKPRTSCPHKSAAKWHLFQTQKDLFRTRTASSPDSTLFMCQESLDGTTHPDVSALDRSVRYIFNEKKIPCTLPNDITAPKTQSGYLMKLRPVETLCQLCPGHPALEEAVQITSKARIVSMMGVINNVSIYNRRCSECNMVYRYQEWKDGLHNFDDNIVVSLELCLFLRQNLQNHVSVSRVINSLEGLRKEKFPARDIMFRAYCHFEALTDTVYTYSCVNCGFYPPVVIMDLHRKGVFNLAVSDLKQPPEDFDGKHNIEQFWNSVHLEMISRGFFPSNANNPFAVHPNYEHWAPWIGSETREGDTVLNTEFKKVLLPSSLDEAQLSSITEDRLVDELIKQKVGVVRKLCRACHIDSKGSRLDMITRLRDKMKSRHAYDKVFQSIWGASGGWSVILCPHGIVYSLKFNIRAESPRDFADLLLSWKHMPNVCIYDFARGLATHANLRVPDKLPFQPHEGRLAEPTEKNIQAARKGKLRVSLPWLHEKAECSGENSHPITGSTDHFVIYDKFHEANTKDPQDILRRIELVPELQGWLNSQVAEQLFAAMRKSNYFLNNMNPSTHVFMMRSIVHHRNTVTNRQLLEQQLKRGHKYEELGNITISDLGQAVIGLRPYDVHKTLTMWAGPGPKTPEQHSPPACSANAGIAPEQYGIGSAMAFTTELTDSTLNDMCGPQCEALTKFDNISASRSSWCTVLHPGQQQLLGYVLDINRPRDELIVRTTKVCLTRGDFWTLGLNQEMESTVGNGCFELIEKIAQSKGRSVYIEDLYVTPTWLPPCNCDPVISLPSDAQGKDALLFPLWTPGHFQLCVFKPGKKEMLFLDSLCAQRKSGFGGQQYVSLLRSQVCNIYFRVPLRTGTFHDLFGVQGLCMPDHVLMVLNISGGKKVLAKSISPGDWLEKTGFDLEGFPTQDFGCDCGIFMLMSALYVALDAPFDYTIFDMPSLRKWWCVLLMENFELDSYGKLFAHWTEASKAVLEGHHVPVFRLKKLKSTEVGQAAIPVKSSQKECMASDLKVCAYQCSEDSGKRVLYPDVQTIEWVQCSKCRGWLHTDCAGLLHPHLRDEPFCCGCDANNTCNRTTELLDVHGVQALLSTAEIKSLHDKLKTGNKKSSRMYLWENPAASLSLKQSLKPTMLHFDEDQTVKLMKIIATATGVQQRIDGGEFLMMDYLFDVLLQEVIIRILEKHEGFSRYQAECTLSKGIKFFK